MAAIARGAAHIDKNGVEVLSVEQLHDATVDFHRREIFILLIEYLNAVCVRRRLELSAARELAERAADGGGCNRNR